MPVPLRPRELAAASPIAAGRLPRARSLSRHLLIAAAFLVAMGSDASDQPAYRVIVNASHPAASGSSARLSRAVVSRAFLGKLRRWPDNGRVAAVDRSLASAIRDKFSRDIHKKSAKGVFEYWKRELYSGRATPPRVKETDAEVIAYVAAREGGIGYVSSNAELPDTVVVVSVRP